MTARQLDSLKTTLKVVKQLCKDGLYRRTAAKTIVLADKLYEELKSERARLCAARRQQGLAPEQEDK